MEERGLSAILEEHSPAPLEVPARNDEALVPVSEPETEAERVGRAERREQKLRAKRKVRARKVTQKATRTISTDLGLDRKEMQAMYRHWKRIHEISGAILANLEAFTRHTGGK